MNKKDNEKMREYSHKIVSRLFGFAGKYKIWFIVASFALIISTIGELALPVLLQKTIDHYILADWLWIEPEKLDPSVSEALSGVKEVYSKGDRIFIRTADQPRLTTQLRRELENRGGISLEPWYIFSWDESYSDPFQAAGIDPEFIEDSNMVAVSKAVLLRLDPSLYNMIRSGDMNHLARNSLFYFLLLTVILIFSFVQMYAMSWTSQGVMKELRVRMLSHTMKQSLGFLGDTPVGTLVSRITSDVETINEFFTSVTISVLRDLAIMAGALITLYLLNPHLAIITILTTPPILVMTVIFRRVARKAYRSQRYWVGKVNGFISEHLTGMEVIQIFGQEKAARKEFNHNNGKLLHASLAEMYVFAVFRPMVDLFTSVSLGIVIYLGAGMYRTGFLTLGVLIAFIDLIQKFYRPVMDMSEKFTIMQSAMAGGERVFQLLDEDKSIPDTGEDCIPADGPGTLEFCNVGFAYKNEDYVLKDLSFTANPGETVAIVGYTGAGKTTIASLAARLWDIQRGHILLNEKDIRDFPLKDLRTTIQTVQQDVFLFSGTIRENIALGADIPFEQIREAARQVQADHFIDKLEKGYDSPVQERGANLSAGQRQLLSFARILVHNPRVVVLDEATANIDSETEKLVQKAIELILKDRTSLVIAHRISTIQKADKILVLSQGELVEQGTHNELLARKDLYYSLYKLQYENHAV